MTGHRNNISRSDWKHRTRASCLHERLIDHKRGKQTKFISMCIIIQLQTCPVPSLCLGSWVSEKAPKLRPPQPHQLQPLWNSCIINAFSLVKISICHSDSSPYSQSFPLWAKAWEAERGTRWRDNNEKRWKPTARRVWFNGNSTKWTMLLCFYKAINLAWAEQREISDCAK